MKVLYSTSELSRFKIIQVQQRVFVILVMEEQCELGEEALRGLRADLCLLIFVK